MNKIIIMILIYFLYKVGFLGKLVNASLPFIMGFVLAYIMYPLEENLNKKIPKYLSVLIIIIMLLLFIFLIIYIIVPISLKEGYNLINILTTFMNNISIQYNINIDIILSKINEFINYNHIINGISLSINVITNIVICFISFIYILIDMDNIRDKIKSINSNLADYLVYVNKDFSKYIGSLVKISIISFFEYTIAFIIIGHPNFLLVGILAGVLNMIPYIGGMLTVFITILLCPSMIIKISILYIILGLVDGYVISPFVYGKYNKINPILGLFALSIGSIFGFVGAISSFPILVIIISSYNYLKENNIDIKKIVNLF
ncbi:MAG: AI-2E family transporter [Bacilli bacterium]|nr:AI-2E family transporter [Bacilli bacterium]